MFKKQTLKYKMDRVNWYLQSIHANAGSLIVLMDYEGDLPLVDPFEWITKDGVGRPNYKCQPGSRPTFFTIDPGLDGENLHYQHLSPEQMAKCIKLLPELREWKNQMETLYKRISDERDTRERADWAHQDTLEAERKARYEAEVAERL